MSNISIISIIMAFIIMLIMTTVVDAKSNSFGGRSSSNSLSNPSKTIYTPKSSSITLNGSRGGFGGRSAITTVLGGSTLTTNKSTERSKPKSIIVTRDNVLSSIGKKGVTGANAGLLYKEFQAKSKPISPQTVLSRTDASQVFSSQYRDNQRHSYYSGYNPPTYTHMSQTSSYGVWDYMMFNAMLDNIGDRQMYYHHQKDLGFQQWRIDANNACLQGDTAICYKLADLDREMDEYRSKGVQVNSTYVTPGIDPSIYTAQNIDTSVLLPIRICTASVTSDYSSFTRQITELTKVKNTIILSNGSVDNLMKLANNQCDAAFVQNDLIQSTDLTKLLTLNQLEVVGIACTASYKNLKDIPKNTSVFIGSDQTGSQFTYNQLIEKIPSFNKLHLDISKSSLQAISDVAETGGCVFGVSTPDSLFFKTLDDTGKFKLIPINTEDLLEHDATYKMVIVMDSHYKNLTQKQFTGFGSDHGTDTLAVPVSLITPQSWIDSNKIVFDILMLNRQALQESIQ